MSLISFLAGVCAATFGASGVFFLKFWRASRDSFFLFFAFSCWLIALERCVAVFVNGIGLALRSPQSEAVSWIYLIRLAGFGILLFAILAKNRTERSAKHTPSAPPRDRQG